MKIQFPTIASTMTLLGLLASTAAFAVGQAPKPFTPIAPGSTAKPDNYVGASIGTAKADAFCADLQSCNADDQSWKIYSAIRATDSLLFELGYTDFGKQSGQDAAGTVTQKATAVTATGLATFPVNEQVELFGKAGLAHWNSTQDSSTGTTKSNGNDIVVGAGADYDLGDNMGLRAEWERYKDIGSADHKSDIDLLSVGVTFSSL